MDKFLKRKFSETSDNETEKMSSTSGVRKKEKTVKRQYSEDYIQYGFSWTGDAEAPKPLCIICGEQLANEAMVPSKLIRHLKSKHASHANKDKQYFQRCINQNKKQKQLMKSTVTISDKALEASYHVAKLIARQKKPHTIGETLIKPACLEIIELMLGPKEAKEISKVPLSADTIKRRIADMADDILGTLIEKLKIAEKFSLQIDETTDINKKAQLLTVVRFVNENSIKEDYLFCKELPERTTGEEIFRITNEFFKTHDIQWSNCVSICTDGASAMKGEVKGFVAFAKRENPAVQVTHCCLHREALMTKVLPQELLETMNECVDIVNFIKTRALNSRIFALLCEEIGSEHQSLLFYTAVRWLSRGKVLARLYELRQEVYQFLSNHDKLEQCQNFENNHWLAKLAYMADIFEHLNELNVKMQGKSENILTCSDKLNGFKQKLSLWQNELKRESFEMFPRTNNETENLNDKQLILDLAEEHLKLLQEKYDYYFFTVNTEQYDWIRNPFSDSAEKSTEVLSLKIREEFLELRNDGTLRLKFNEIPLDTFWISVKKEYPEISREAITILLQFSTTYICEQSFSTLLLIKNEKRSVLKDVDEELRVALSNTEPNIQRLCSSKQAQISH